MKIIGKYILRILMFLILVSVILFFYINNLKNFFFTNQTLNSIILIVIFCGIIYVLRQLLILVNELNWLNQLLKGDKTKLSIKSPNIGIFNKRVSKSNFPFSDS